MTASILQHAITVEDLIVVLVIFALAFIVLRRL